MPARLHRANRRAGRPFGQRELVLQKQNLLFVKRNFDFAKQTFVVPKPIFVFEDRFLPFRNQNFVDGLPKLLDGKRKSLFSRATPQTLNRKSITSPSCTTYSFPSERSFPASR